MRRVVRVFPGDEDLRVIAQAAQSHATIITSVMAIAGTAFSGLALWRLFKRDRERKAELNKLREDKADTSVVANYKTVVQDLRKLVDDYRKENIIVRKTLAECDEQRDRVAMQLQAHIAEHPHR